MRLFHLFTRPSYFFFFFFNDTATTEIYTLSLHDALPIYVLEREDQRARQQWVDLLRVGALAEHRRERVVKLFEACVQDRKSTRLNSSHSQISYAVFCLKKKKKNSNMLDIV